MRRRRRKQLIIITLILVLSIGLIVFFRKSEETRIITQDQIAPVEGLSMEEKLEDFEYLHSFIKDNYPLLWVKDNINWPGEKDKFKKIIEDSTSDEMFISGLKRMLNELNDELVFLIDDSLFKGFYGAYTNPKNEDKYKPWAEVIDDEKVLKRYRFDKSQLKILEDLYKDDGVHTRPVIQDHQAFKSDIILPDEVAYLKFYSMDVDRIEKDGKLIREFLEEVKDYKKLIFDVRTMNYWVGDENTYWIKNIVEPLINEEVSVDNYILRRGDYGGKFQKYGGLEFLPISELTDDQIDKELKNNYDYFGIINTTIRPVDPIGFNGEIYILIDQYSVYIAEDFAAFFKEGGLATIIGEGTRLENPHFENIIFTLPNSGLLVYMRDVISLNKDGSIREVERIKPDVEIDATISQSYDRDKAIQYVIDN